MAQENNAQFDPLGGLIGAGLGYGLASQNGLNQQQIGQAGQTALGQLQGFANGSTGQQVSQSVLGSYNNPYLDQSIAAGSRSLQNQFQNQVLPQITDIFSNAGSLGSGRQAALTGQATQNFTNKLADIDAQQRSQAYKAAYTAAVNAGGNNFDAQQNATGKIFTQAANNAGQAPWLQAISGAGLGSNLGGYLGQNGVGGAAGGAANAIGQVANKASNYLSQNFPNIFSPSFTPPPGAQVAGNGGYSWPTADGGSILRSPDGSINITDSAGNVDLFSNSGQLLGNIPGSNVGIEAGFGSGISDTITDTSWIDDADWSSWF